MYFWHLSALFIFYICDNYFNISAWMFDDMYVLCPAGSSCLVLLYAGFLSCTLHSISWFNCSWWCMFCCLHVLLTIYTCPIWQLIGRLYMCGSIACLYMLYFLARYRPLFCTLYCIIKSTACYMNLTILLVMLHWPCGMHFNAWVYVYHYSSYSTALLLYCHLLRLP